MGLIHKAADLSRKTAKIKYDDKNGVFLSYDPKSKLQARNYEMALTRLWKAEELAPYLDICDGACGEIGKERDELIKKLTEQKFSDFHKSVTRRERRGIHEILSLLVHGEAYALSTSSSLMGIVDTTEARLALAAQVIEEAKHFVVLRAMTVFLFGTIRPLKPSGRIFFDRIMNQDGLAKLTGMNVILENFALILFERLSKYPVLSDIVGAFHLDESRHTGLPINYADAGHIPSSEKGVLARLNRSMMLATAPMLVNEYWIDFMRIGLDPFDVFEDFIIKITELADRSQMPFLISKGQARILVDLSFPLVRKFLTLPLR